MTFLKSFSRFFARKVLALLLKKHCINYTQKICSTLLTLHTFLSPFVCNLKISHAFLEDTRDLFGYVTNLQLKKACIKRFYCINI